jgi:hypothetical protein
VYLEKNFALAALALVFLLGAAQAQSPNSVPDQLKTIQAQFSDLEAQNASLATQVASNGPRKFYLTKTTPTGAGALSACAMGYHMASQWEILDPTNLRYNTDLGVTFADSDSGPPANIGGWIRTGGVSGPAQLTGLGNCNAWTTASATAFGTIAFLPSSWTATGTRVSPWDSVVDVCVAVQPVWCVQD